MSRLEQGGRRRRCGRRRTSRGCRNVAERRVNMLKQWRGVALHHEKRALNYRAAVVIATIALWLAVECGSVIGSRVWRRGGRDRRLGAVWWPRCRSTPSPLAVPAAPRCGQPRAPCRGPAPSPPSGWTARPAQVGARHAARSLPRRSAAGRGHAPPAATYLPWLLSSFAALPWYSPTGNARRSRRMSKPVSPGAPAARSLFWRATAP